ncbi:MAG: hypothetical protein PWR27_778 [Petroclostridium sp.]|jgi:hypothetical protein|uniref:DUF4321 domain-containing protein n=1 Tax=Petroclostridium xylanilyticum TaxID=1792311 RepID=UPI001FA853E0|nr:DUF4321 domain-containing protein [Petroclostridium xylanilyticum]MBZ4645004.1 hypothetical protein [Clostridia bacterium]MDK2810069.1 hypothetical protein [Petroclostridium sp.]
MMKRERNIWLLLLLLLVGVVIGGFLGEFLSRYPYLSFLSYGKQFGISLDKPFLLDLHILKLSFALIFNINIASIIGIILSVVIFSKL